MDTKAKSCRSAWADMADMCADRPVRNVAQILDMSDYIVETELFPLAVLEAYSAWNTGREISEEQRLQMNPERGGAQGDYREGMAGKIDNVVDCLAKFPQSKRAVISTANNPAPHHSNDADAKCVRELHLYIDDDARLSGTLLLRAQAVSLFPKNIHMVGTIMEHVAARLPQRPALGTVFYLATILVADRS